MQKPQESLFLLFILLSLYLTDSVNQCVSQFNGHASYLIFIKAECIGITSYIYSFLHYRHKTLVHTEEIVVSLSVIDWTTRGFDVCVCVFRGVGMNITETLHDMHRKIGGIFNPDIFFLQTWIPRAVHGKWSISYKHVYFLTQNASSVMPGQ